jgi:hypothetical protein
MTIVATLPLSLCKSMRSDHEYGGHEKTTPPKILSTIFASSPWVPYSSGWISKVLFPMSTHKAGLGKGARI